MEKNNKYKFFFTKAIYVGIYRKIIFMLRVYNIMYMHLSFVLAAFMGNCNGRFPYF